MKKLLFLLCFLTFPAHAQSTSDPVVLGTLSVVGSGTIWTPISTTNPLPATLVIGP